MRKFLLFICFVFLLFPFVNAQGIRGVVVDQHREPVDGVAVVLQTPDSVFLDATITDPDGQFVFDREPGQYILYFQHVLYHTYQQETGAAEVGMVFLKEKENLLQDVTVTAHRPQVKVEAGKLIYDTPQLISNKPVTNAFEAIKELPGILSTDDSIELVGAAGLHIVINGQLTTMTLEQLISMLKTIPASRVKSTEIMYNAPARYNVNGALINVVLDQPPTEGETFQGEAGAGYEQHYFAQGEAYANLLYAKARLNVDVLLNGAKGRTHTEENMFARHQLGDERVEVDQNNGGKSCYDTGSLRLGLGYKLKNEDQLSAAYYLSGTSSDARRFSSTTYDYLERGIRERGESRTDMDSRKRLQNVLMQYEGHTGVTVGMDYTHYYSPDHQHYRNEQESDPRDLLNDSEQTIHKWMVFSNHSFSVAEKWNANYGVNLSMTRSNTLVDYWNREGTEYVPDEELNLDSRQKEWGGNMFAEVSRSFGKLSAQVALKVEYFRSDYDTKLEKTTLWNDWALFPTASLSYAFHPFHILQLNVSSDKSYPSYWTVNPQVSYLNSYSVVVGNPELKPSREYNVQLNYILNQRYMFLVFVNYNPDKFTQLPYQNPETLQNMFRFENLNYSLTTGLALITPFKVGRVLDSRLTLQGFRIQDKSDHFYDTPFDNSRLVGRVALNNTFNLAESVKLTIHGFYVSPAQQGVYRLGDFYDVSAGLKWLFANNKGTFTLKYENIFRSHYPSYMRIDVRNQYSNMSLYDDSSYLGIAFSWKFGGYKEKSYKAVDSSRFGK